MLDQSPFSNHLWYLQALIKVLLVAWIIKKFSWEWLYKFFPLLLLPLLLETFSLLSNHQLATKEMYFSLPFFAISLFLLLQRYEIPLDRHIINKLAAMTPYVYILHMVFIKMHRVLKLSPDIRILFVLICSTQDAAELTVLPEEALAAVLRLVVVVADPIDQDSPAFRFISHCDTFIVLIPGMS